jgi:hypothetical protein
MANETITDLRGHLFRTLDQLANTTTPPDLERARAVAEIAQTLINSAKVEVEFLKVTGGEGSGFIPAADHSPGTRRTSLPGATIIQHRLQG